MTRRPVKLTHFRTQQEKGPSIETERPNLSHGRHRRLQIQGAESGLIGDPDATSWLMLFSTMVVAISLQQESSGKTQAQENVWRILGNIRHSPRPKMHECMQLHHMRPGTATAQLPVRNICQLCISVI